MCSKVVDVLAYSEDPDNTGQSNLGLLCLISSVNTETLDDYVKCQWPDA